ncbi:MAG: SusD/RagB family nutrient-binding outer membrane lipoprotein, partial [Bacteroidales bacterium]
APDYEYRNDINNSIWNSFYVAMRICVDAMRVAKIEENNNIYAAATIMKVFYGNKATNCWGDIPYSEAFKIEGYLHPKYDSQKDIYIQQLNELKEAADLLDPQGKPIGEGDFLFKGNILKWKKFCNSLRLRLAIYAASGEQAIGLPTLQEIANDLGRYPIITKNDDNAYWWFSGIAPDEERWYKENLGLRDASGYKTSKWRSQYDFVRSLVKNNDPRTCKYFDINKSGRYNGYRMGVGQTSNTSNRIDSTSAFGDRFCADSKGFMPFMNSAEVYFCLAEAALKGYIQGGETQAKSYYEEGIKASCMENGIDNLAISKFLNEPEVKWGSGTTPNLGKIALQKWIVLLKQSIEAWTEARRSDVPKLENIDEMYIGRHNRPPFRLVYSESDRALNDNFPKDVIENDLFYGGQLWWDKRKNVK